MCASASASASASACMRVCDVCRGLRWHELLPAEFKPSTDFEKEWDVVPEWLLEPQRSSGAMSHRPDWMLRSAHEDGSETDLLNDAGSKRPERVKWLVAMGEFLLKHRAITLPPLRWTGETKAERLAIDRVGFLFKYYQVAPTQPRAIAAHRPRQLAAACHARLSSSLTVRALWAVQCDLWYFEFIEVCCLPAPRHSAPAIRPRPPSSLSIPPWRCVAGG
jgi:hypothetical protein